MRDDELEGAAKSLIDTIAAKARFAGSAAEQNARELCAAELEKAGFATSGTEFEFSEWPGRFGIPLVAGATLMAIALTAAAATRDVRLGGLTLMASFLAGHRVLRSLRDGATRNTRWLRSQSVNLEAVRGAKPIVWLVAHLDSKSQTVPMLVRVASHIALAAVVLATVGMIFLAIWGAIYPPHWGWLAGAALTSALPSLFCLVGNISRGALDNATGVAAVLLAARLVPQTIPLGVLITSGEELDLAGARAWAAERRGEAWMINCDTIDDAGDWRCMFGKAPRELGPAAEKAAKKLGLSLRMGRVIPGIITDSLAFETAGLRSVTLSRGTVQTLARLHTRGDIPDRLTGTGAATAARLLAQMVEELA